MNYLYRCTFCGETSVRTFLGAELACPGVGEAVCPSSGAMNYVGMTFLEPTWPIGPSKPEPPVANAIRAHVPNLGVIKFWPLRHTVTLTPNVELEGIVVEVQERPDGIDATITHGPGVQLLDLVATINHHPLLQGKFIAKIGVDDP